MNRRSLIKTSIGTALALILAQQVGAQEMDETSQASFDTVMAFMAAMNKGPDAMSPLPWIGETTEKKPSLSSLEFSEPT